LLESEAEPFGLLLTEYGESGEENSRQNALSFESGHRAGEGTAAREAQNRTLVSQRVDL